MLWTTLAFVLFTVGFATWHVRRHSSGDAPRCPRCKAVLPAGATQCNACGVPLSAFEVVGAAVSSTEEEVSTGRPHAIVRADLCVGCSTCVDACPEEGALHLESKLAVVDLARCVGHGDCAAACPVGAIVVSAGGSVQRVEVPQVDVNFESNVPGLYIVGELGGRGLIKNAINEGRIAAEHVAATIQSQPAPDEELYDLAIVGSGPAGLSAGLEAKRQGLRYLLLEQGTLADSIRKYPRHKLLLAEPINVPLYGDLWISDTTKEALLKAWEAIIETTGLQVRTGSRVKNARSRNGHFELELEDGVVRARCVILAMGRRGTPRRLGIPGEESGHVFYDIVEMEAFLGRRVLVVGGGDSAIESALGLCNQEGCEVTLSYRGDSFRRVKERNLAKLEKALESQRLSLLLQSQLRRIYPGRVEIEVEGKIQELHADDVIIRIGGEPPSRFLAKAGVAMVNKDIPLVSSEV
jgi:thioredoxin reductase/Pyruvate/2-oxoacid:ferredoxin oxidoreductase delta subunit